MSDTGLFNGVAVIIDDQVFDEQQKIYELVAKLEAENVPCVKYKELPDIAIIAHLKNISFLLLDWRLDNEALTEVLQESPGVTAPGLADEDVKFNIDFLKELTGKCFIPIFIFTNEDISTVTDSLKENGLDPDTECRNIFVKSKSELLDNDLFVVLNTWAKSILPVYTLKEWEKEYNEAKQKLFLDFYNISHSWPKILWDNYGVDDVNQSKAIGDSISRNLHSRMSPFAFNSACFDNHVGSTVEKNELRKVLQGERIVSELHDDDIGTGDIFRVVQPGGAVTYYLNIRAQCDLKGATPDLYILKGKELNEELVRSGFNDELGLFLEKDREAILPFVYHGNVIVFQLGDLLRKTWPSLKDSRIGRLIPPYLTKIQQKYSWYMQRQGLPKIPSHAIREDVIATAEADG